MTDFMLLKINYTNGSSSWPSIQRGGAVCFCVSFSQSWPVNSVVFFLAWGCVNVTTYVPTCSPRGWQNPSTYGLVSHCCHSQYSSADRNHGCCLPALCDFSSLCFYFSFCFSLPHTAVSLSASCSSASTLTCWRRFLHLGNDFILPSEKPTSSPKFFFSNTPESWEQETVSIFSSFQNILGHSDTAGIKAGTHQKHPNQEEQPWSFQCLRLLSSLPVHYVHLISSLPCLLFLLQAQQRNLCFTKLS